MGIKKKGGLKSWDQFIIFSMTLYFLASFLIKTRFPFVVNVCPLIFITVLKYKLAVSGTTGTAQREELREGRTLAPPPPVVKKKLLSRGNQRSL